MWLLVIPFLVLTSFTGSGPAVAAAPEVIERATWPGGGPPAFATRQGAAARGTARGEGRNHGRDVEFARWREDTSSRSDRDGPRLDVNACSYEDLLRLPGIGPKKARAILEERGRRPFRSVHDLRRVKGIGPRTVQRLAPYVTAGAAKAGD